MIEPIKLPPDLLAVTLVREGVNKHRARDIECWMNEKMALAVEQATADLRAERDALRADAERYAYVLANARRIDICRVSLVDTNMDQLSARIDAALKEAK